MREMINSSNVVKTLKEIDCSKLSDSDKLEIIEWVADYGEITFTALKWLVESTAKNKA